MSPISGLTRLDQEWCLFPVFIGPVSAEYTRTGSLHAPQSEEAKNGTQISRRKAVIHESNTVFCVLGIPNTPDKIEN